MTCITPNCMVTVVCKCRVQLRPMSTRLPSKLNVVTSCLDSMISSCVLSSIRFTLHQRLAILPNVSHFKITRRVKFKSISSSLQLGKRIFLKTSSWLSAFGYLMNVSHSVNRHVGLWATWNVHFRLIGKLAVDFLSVMNELLSLGVTAEALRANID